MEHRIQWSLANELHQRGLSVQDIAHVINALVALQYTHETYQNRAIKRLVLGFDGPPDKKAQLVEKFTPFVFTEADLENYQNVERMYREMLTQA